MTAGAATTSAPDPLPAGRLRSEAARVLTETLFREHGRLVTGLCRGLLRNADEAEDAAQQAFLSAHGALLRGAVPRDPAAWLTTIARHECLARIRERMRRPLPVADADTAVSSRDPVVEATRRADMAALWRAVGALAPQQRDAMLLREFGGLSYAELAVALGVSIPAVESLLFRARTKLRAELKTIAAALGGLLPRLLAGGGVAKVAGLTVATGIVTGGVVATDRVPHTPPAPRLPHHALVGPPTVQRRNVAVTQTPTVARTRTPTPAQEDRTRESDVAEHDDGRDRTTVVEPTAAPSLTVDGGSRDMSDDATATSTTATSPASTSESGHDGGTDGSNGDGGGGDGGGDGSHS